MGGGVLKVGAFAVDSDPGTAFFGRRGGQRGWRDDWAASPGGRWIWRMETAVMADGDRSKEVDAGGYGWTLENRRQSEVRCGAVS